MSSTRDDRASKDSFTGEPTTRRRKLAVWAFVLTFGGTGLVLGYVLEPLMESAFMGGAAESPAPSLPPPRPPSPRPPRVPTPSPPPPSPEPPAQPSPPTPSLPPSPPSPRPPWVALPPAPPADDELLSRMRVDNRMLARLGARQSSTYANVRVGASSPSARTEFAASRAIDGDATTFSATGHALGAWLSVRLPPASRVGYVSLRNRPDAPFAHLLDQFAIVVGGAYGDTTSPESVHCGTARYALGTPSQRYTLWCGGASGEYVTLKQTGGVWRQLGVAELEPYEAPPRM